jgi:hypothetical protein
MSVDYVCRTEVTAVPAVKTESVGDSSSSIHRSYRIDCKRKENARAESRGALEVD